MAVFLFQLSICILHEFPLTQNNTDYDISSCRAHYSSMLLGKDGSNFTSSISEGGRDGKQGRNKR